MPARVKKPTKKEQATLDTIELGIRMREKIRNKIIDAIVFRETILTTDEVKERARKIETSLYNWTIRSINKSNSNPSRMKPVPTSMLIAKNTKKPTTNHDDNLERKLKWGNKMVKMPNSKLDANWNCAYFKTRYCNRAINIIFNIKDTRNKGFIKAIVEKSVPLREIANLNADEIFPELWKPIKEKVWKKEVIHGHGIDNINDGVEQCGKCKSMKTTYYSLQTRSADEPMTNFFTCHNCGKHWKT